MVSDKDINSLDHTSWRCQDHIVFAPQYRRMEIYGEIKSRYGKDTAATMPAKECGNYRSRTMRISHPDVHKHTAEV